MHPNGLGTIIIIIDEEGEPEVKFYVQDHSCTM